MADPQKQTEPSKTEIDPAVMAAARAQIEAEMAEKAAAEEKARREAEQAATDAANPEGYPLFVSASGKPVMLALLSGHSITVADKPVPLHPRFHRQATMQGVVHIEVLDHYRKMHGLDEDKPRREKTKRELIKAEITKMVAEAADDLKRQAELFSGDGLPIATQLSTRCGFHVSASERDDAWAEFDAGDEGGEV